MTDDLFGKITPPMGLGGEPTTVIGIAAGAGLKIFFVAAGIIALIFLLRGSLNWISSGGDKEKIEKARHTLTNAVIGLLIIFVILAGIYTLENVIFPNGQFCIGLTCPIDIPTISR
ncbi:MAG: hypothetical protein ABH812_01650 [bacterium]